MTPEEWRRIKTVAADAWEQPADSRAAFIDAACAGDQALRDQVLGLMESAQAASELYEVPAMLAPHLADAFAAATDGGPSLAGTMVGPYRLAGEIGRGGMGRVFLADRADGEFDQKVAIKVVGGLPTGALLQRFRDERRILASLEHPNIARLIDGGATPDGQPYLVMEYIDGVAIDRFCDERKLDTRARVTLFRRVCEGVQYAHQRLVIHRDLKAGNILVMADGTPKLLDFGIAKLVEPGGINEPTRTMFRAMTPETASPEQIRGELVTTSTDVYALGGLLYRLLTGQSQYVIASSTDQAWMQAICEQVPSPPSARVPHAGIDKDLDLIVLKALRKEPERRYTTVSQLSEDLQRYLDGRPVHAAPDRRSYRMRKFVGRHRLAIGAAAAVVVAVAAGTLTTAREAQIARRERARAEGRFEDVRQLANSFIFDVHDAIARLPGSTPARRLLITRVLEYLEKLDRDTAAESGLRLEIARAYLKVGDVQGNPYHANIGDAAGAAESYRRALAIAQALVDRDPGPDHRDALAASHQRVAEMYWAEGSFANAQQHYETTIALRDALSTANPASDQATLDLAQAHYGLGQTMLRTGDYARANESYRKAHALQSGVIEQNPANALARQHLGTSAAKIGDVMSVQGNHAGALEYHRKAVGLLKEQLTRAPDSVVSKRLLVLMLGRVTIDQTETGDQQGAIATGIEALALQQPILVSDPTNRQALFDSAEAHRMLGTAYVAAKQPRAALQQFDEAEKALRAVRAANPDLADSVGSLAVLLLLRADVLRDLGDARPAQQAYREAAALLETQSARAETVRHLAMTHERAGDLERELARSAPAAAAAQHERDACRHYQQGLDALKQPGRANDPRERAQAGELARKLAGCASGL